MPLSAQALVAEVSGTGSEPLKPDIVNMHHFFDKVVLRSLCLLGGWSSLSK